MPRVFRLPDFKTLFSFLVVSNLSVMCLVWSHLCFFFFFFFFFTAQVDRYFIRKTVDSTLLRQGSRPNPEKWHVCIFAAEVHRDFWSDGLMSFIN